MKYIFFIMLSFFLFSCRKERTLHVKAINGATGLPYTGLRFVVTEEKSGALEEDYKTVYDGNLDNNGEAYAIVKIRKNRSYSIRCEEPSNTCYNKKINYSYAVEDNQNPTFLFEFAECAYLKLSINNANCQGVNDLLNLYQGNQIGTYNYNEPWAHAGCVNYLSSQYSKVAIGKQYYKWEVTRNSITNTFYDTIYLSPGEYRTYEINY